MLNYKYIQRKEEIFMKILKKILAGVLCAMMVLSVCGTLIYYIAAAI